MTEHERKEIAEKLNLFPEVEWDRFVEMDGEWEGQGSAFGWLRREDGYADFVDIAWWDRWDLGGALAFGLSTSSAAHSLEFTQRLNGQDAPHFDCQRVEDRFGDLVEKVIRA